MLPNFYAYMVATLTKNNDIIVGTNYGPLFLDETDFGMFNFDPNWLIDNIDTQDAQDLLCTIKMYYMEQAQQLLKDGVL